MAKKGNRSLAFKILVVTGIILIMAGVITAYKAYNVLYKSNVTLSGDKSTYLYIKTGSSFDDVLSTIKDLGILSDLSSFEWLADYKD